MLSNTFATQSFPDQSDLPLEVEVLDARHAKEVCLLIDTVRADLPEDKRHYLKPRSPEDISEHFTAFNPGFGIFDGGKLVACALLCPIHDATSEYNQRNYPQDHLLPGHWAIQSVARHPAYKGLGLMEKLLDHAATYSRLHPNIDYVVAKVNANNTPSQKGFLGAGFDVAARGQDYASGEPVVYLGLSTGSGLARTTQKPVQLGNDDPSPAPFC